MRGMSDPTPTPAPAAPASFNPALIPAGWCGLALLATCFLGALVAWAGMNSESAGERAALFTSLPIGFLGGGALAAVGIHLGMKSASQGVRLGAPFGCGCLGAVGLFGLVFLFFAVIFPAL